MLIGTLNAPRSGKVILNCKHQLCLQQLLLLSTPRGGGDRNTSSRDPRRSLLPYSVTIGPNSLPSEHSEEIIAGHVAQRAKEKGSSNLCTLAQLGLSNSRWPPRPYNFSPWLAEPCMSGLTQNPPKAACLLPQSLSKQAQASARIPRHLWVYVLILAWFSLKVHELYVYVQACICTHIYTCASMHMQ